MEILKEKSFSESNMRRIISYMKGLSTTLQEIENQCINLYDADKVYTTGQAVFHVDSVTNKLGLFLCDTITSGEWNPNAWTSVNDVIVEYLGKSDIDDMMSSVSAETWKYFENIIADDSVSITKTWSSSKVYAEITDYYDKALEYIVKYVTRQKLVSYKKVNSTSDIVDDTTLYLVPNADGEYEIYVLDTSVNAPLKISNATVSLDDYYTKDEVDTDFVKVTDANLKFKTIKSYEDEIGNLTTLETESKTIVGAINEVSKRSKESVSIDDDSTTSEVDTWSAKKISDDLNNKLEIGTKLENDVDLDTIKTTGVYIAEWGNLSANRPSCFTDKYEFTLEVYKGTTSNVLQRITSRKGISCVRNYAVLSGSTWGWSEWQRLATENNTFDISNTLKSGDDLDEIKTPNRIYTFSSGGILNAPSSAYTNGNLHGYLEVIKYSAYTSQKLITFVSGVVYIYFRRLSGSTWSEWRTVPSINDASTSLINTWSANKLNYITKNEGNGYVAFDNGAYYYAIANEDGTLLDTISNDLVRSTSTIYSGKKVSCKKGEFFTLNGTGGIVPRLWCFTDSNNKVISASAASTSCSALVLEAPENGYLFVNSTITADRKLVRGKIDYYAFTESLTASRNVGCTLTSGKYWDLSGDTLPSEMTTEANYSCCKVKAAPGEWFSMIGKSGSTKALLYAFVDIDGNIIKKDTRANYTTNSYQEFVQAPAKTEYAVFNSAKVTSPAPCFYRGLANSKYRLYSEVSDAYRKARLAEQNLKFGRTLLGSTTATSAATITLPTNVKFSDFSSLILVATPSSNAKQVTLYQLFPIDMFKTNAGTYCIFASSDGSTVQATYVDDTSFKAYVTNKDTSKPIKLNVYGTIKNSF